jgi:hypothetical protein
MGLKPIPFRCERCGYDLTAVAGTDTCAECGTPASESLPSARPGLPCQRRGSFGAWLSTAIRYCLHPRLIYREVRLESRCLRRLAFLHFGLAFLVALAPFAIVAWFGERSLVTTPTPGSFHILIDPHATITTFLVGIIAGIGLPAVWVTVRWHAPRRKPPMAGAAVWASAALTSLGVLIAAVITNSAWLLRYAITPSQPIVAPSPPTGWIIAMVAPTLFFLALITAAAVIDLVANRWNRLANTMDAR